MDQSNAKKRGQAYPLRRSTVALMEAAVAIRRIRLTVKQVCVQREIGFRPLIIPKPNPFPLKLQPIPPGTIPVCSSFPPGLNLYRNTLRNINHTTNIPSWGHGVEESLLLLLPNFVFLNVLFVSNFLPPFPTRFHPFFQIRVTKNV